MRVSRLKSKSGSSSRTGGTVQCTGKGHSTYTYSGYSMVQRYSGLGVGCPNFASKKVSLQSETKRNTNGFAWFRFLFRETLEKKFGFISLHFASKVSLQKFRFVLLKNMFRFKVSLREQFRFKFFA